MISKKTNETIKMCEFFYSAIKVLPAPPFRVLRTSTYGDYQRNRNFWFQIPTDYNLKWV